MVQSIPFPEPDPKGFWQAYLAWQGQASEDELRQVEIALEDLQAQEVMSLARAMHLALGDEHLRRALPQTLVRKLQAPVGSVACGRVSAREVQHG